MSIETKDRACNKRQYNVLNFASIENILIDHNTEAYTVDMPSFIIIKVSIFT